jgi:hypothetical protein
MDTKGEASIDESIEQHQETTNQQSRQTVGLKDLKVHFRVTLPRVPLATPFQHLDRRSIARGPRSRLSIGWMTREVTATSLDNSV